jgi:hypothetical protein
MNSFKKIALALVAAMTLSTIIATPASAANTVLTVGGNAAVGGTAAAAPVELPVPSDNSVDLSDALRINVSGLDTGTTVSAVATNGKIVTSLTAPVTAAAGSSSVSVNTGTGNTADLFVFTTTNTAGSVAVTIGANTTTYYFRGLAGALSSIALSAPDSAGAGTNVDVKVTGYDVFGNLRSNATINLQVITAASSVTTPLLTDTVTATFGTKTQSVAIPASGKVTLVATATVAAAIPGLASPVGVAIKEITVRDLAGELAAEKAARAADKVAADKALADAKVASDKALADAKADADKALADAKAASDKVLADAKAAHAAELAKVKADNDAVLAALKKAFNSLAKKWNKKNPSAKVNLVR